LVFEIMNDGFISKLSEQTWEKLNPYTKKKITQKDFDTLFTAQFKNHPGLEAEYNRIAKNIIAAFKALEPGLIQKIPEDVNNLIGILSLTRNPDNSLMWSHYTNNHTGFVIEFDENHIFFSPRQEGDGNLYGLTEVKYYKDRPEIEALVDGTLTWDIWFFFKSKDWEYEKELRMLLPLSKAAKIIYLFSIPTESIKSIIFGLKMLNDDKEKILQLVNHDPRYKHLKIFNTIMDNKSFSIKIESI